MNKWSIICTSRTGPLASVSNNPAVSRGIFARNIEKLHEEEAADRLLDSRLRH